MRTFLIAVAIVGTAAHASAQTWQLEGRAGRTQSALDPAGSAQNAAVGLRFDQGFTALRLSVGVPTSGDAPLWGAAGSSIRVAKQQGAFTLGVDLAGHGYLLRDRKPGTREITDLFGRSTLEPTEAMSGFAAAGQVMPVVAYTRGAMQAQLRAGASAYTAEFAEQRRTRNVGLADAQLTVTPAPSFALSSQLKHVRAEEDAYSAVAVTGIFAGTRGSLWGSAGQWISGSSATMYAAGATLKLHERAQLNATVQHDGFDPLYLNPAQTSWSIGAGVLLNRAPSLRRPLTAVAQNGRALIQLKGFKGAEVPRIAGDFNNWKPEPMQRADNEWTYQAKLEPGVYSYAFVNARGEWFIPEGHPGRKADGMGGHQATLVVQ